MAEAPAEFFVYDRWKPYEDALFLRSLEDLPATVNFPERAMDEFRWWIAEEFPDVAVEVVPAPAPFPSGPGLAVGLTEVVKVGGAVFHRITVCTSECTMMLLNTMLHELGHSRVAATRPEATLGHGPEWRDCMQHVCHLALHPIHGFPPLHEVSRLLGVQPWELVRIDTGGLP